MSRYGSLININPSGMNKKNRQLLFFFTLMTKLAFHSSSTLVNLIFYLRLLKYLKTCVINDPLGQAHSPTSSDHYFHASFALFCGIFKSIGSDVRTEICTKIMITTGRVCG